MISMKTMAKILGIRFKNAINFRDFPLKRRLCLAWCLPEFCHPTRLSRELDHLPLGVRTDRGTEMKKRFVPSLPMQLGHQFQKKETV